jgi:hypothetical protein
VAALLVVGGGLAIAQTGDLGGEDAAAPAQETTSSTTSTTAADGTTTTTVAVTTTAAPPTTFGADAPAPTVAGSGLNVAGSPSGGSDGIADTGGESMIGAGMALGALGLALRRVSRVRPA